MQRCNGLSASTVYIADGNAAVVTTRPIDMLNLNQPAHSVTRPRHKAESQDSFNDLAGIPNNRSRDVAMSFGNNE